MSRMVASKLMNQGATKKKSRMIHTEFQRDSFGPKVRAECRKIPAYVVDAVDAVGASTLLAWYRLRRLADAKSIPLKMSVKVVTSTSMAMP